MTLSILALKYVVKIAVLYAALLARAEQSLIYCFFEAGSGICIPNGCIVSLVP